MPRFFVPRMDIEAGSISGAELEHMRKVLRLRPGDRVTLFDGEGWEYEGIIESYGSRAAEIKIVQSCRPARESPLDIILAQALGRGEKMDWVVEKATELGVRTIVPFFSSYTVPRLDVKKMQGRLERWNKIALSATKQSGRVRIPEILPLMDFEALVCRTWPAEEKLFFWEGGANLQRLGADLPRLRSVLLALGPEGGFSDEERSRALQNGFRMVSLGKRILRTETAALTALSLAQFLWGDMS